MSNVMASEVHCNRAAKTSEQATVAKETVHISSLRFSYFTDQQVLLARRLTVTSTTEDR